MTTDQEHIAKRIRALTDGFRGNAALYRLEPPMVYTDYFGGHDGEDVERRAEYVIVSAADAFMSGPETYIFPGTDTGTVASWNELPGSFKGGLDHSRALAGAGYTIEES